MADFKHKVRFKDVRAENVTPSKLALVCWINGEQHFIPLSQIDDDSEVFGSGDEGELVISEWIAIQKGLV